MWTRIKQEIMHFFSNKISAEIRAAKDNLKRLKFVTAHQFYLRRKIIITLPPPIPFFHCHQFHLLCNKQCILIKNKKIFCRINEKDEALRSGKKEGKPIIAWKIVIRRIWFLSLDLIDISLIWPYKILQQSFSRSYD